MLRRNDDADRRHLAQAKDDEHGALDERDDHDLDDGQSAQQRRDGDARERREADEVARDHEPAAVDPIHHRPGRKLEQDVGQRADEAHDAGRRGGTRHRQHQQRVGDLRDP